MKRYKRLTAWLAIGAMLTGFAPAASAFDLSVFEQNRALGLSVARHSITDEVFSLRIATNIDVADGPTVEVNAGGDIIFTIDGTAADTTIGLPTLDGTIDVSDATANTMGEVIDNINESANWGAVLVDALPSDLSTDVLLLTAETSTATGLSATYDLDGKGVLDPEGMPFAVDLAVVDHISSSIGIEYSNTTLFLPGTPQGRLTDRRANPERTPAAHFRSELYQVIANGTFGTGTTTFTVFLVDGVGVNAVELTVWQEVGALTTVDFTFDLTDLPAIRTQRGQRYVIRYENITTPALTAGTIQVHGLAWEE